MTGFMNKICNFEYFDIASCKFIMIKILFGNLNMNLKVEFGKCFLREFYTLHNIFVHRNILRFSPHTTVECNMNVTKIIKDILSCLWVLWCFGSDYGIIQSPKIGKGEQDKHVYWSFHKIWNISAARSIFKPKY